MTFSATTTRHFDKKFRKLTRKNQTFKDRVFGKISEIMENPEIGVPKKNELKGLRGVHVDPFVIIYVVIDDQIVLLHLAHHDHVYCSDSIFTPAQIAELRLRFPGFDQT